jgi:hypothetical protein
MGPGQLSQMAECQGDVTAAEADQPLQQRLDHWGVAKRHQRLGEGHGEGVQSGAAATGQDHRLHLGEDAIGGGRGGHRAAP